MKRTVLALVYVDYEGLNLLEIGNEKFILSKFIEYFIKITDFNEKYKDFNYLSFPDDYYDNPLSEIANIKNLCIRGYKGDKITCVCKKYNLKLNKLLIEKMKEYQNGNV